MEKYIYIRDISARPCYQNVNARLLYLHIACNVELSTYSYCHSWRTLAAELGMSYQNLRTALKQLEKDGLIATQQVTQQATYGATRKVTYKVTHIRLLKITELDEPANEPANSQANSQSNSQSNSIKINNNNKQQEPFTLTNARERVSSFAAALGAELGLNPSEAADLAGKWLQRMRLKKKTWTDEADALSHLVSWAEKHTPLRNPKKLSRAAEDHAARMEEYAATEERKQEQTEQEKDEETWGRMMRFAAECESKGDEWRMLDFLASAHQLCEKWGWKKMSIAEYNKRQKERRKRK